MGDEAAVEGQRRLWSSGNYPAVAERLEVASPALLDAVGVGPGDRVLDVGVGSGNTALEAARRGATVTGVDLTPRQLELARARADAAGIPLDLHEGNAEDLPFPDGGFDAVVSVFGVIFVPDHVRAAAEMARVCAPGGTVGLTAWTAADGWYRNWRARAAALVPPPPPGTGQPDDWGDVAVATRRLTAAGLEDVTAEPRELQWTFADADEAVAFFLTNAAPFILFRQAATAAGHGDKMVPAVHAAVVESNVAAQGIRLPAPYLVVTAHRPR
jgi:SAM-dependent methyltransferase